MKAPDLEKIDRDSRESLARAGRDLGAQREKAHRDRILIGRYDQIIADNSLAEVVRRAFSGDQL